MLGRLAHAACALLLGAATFVGSTAHLCTNEGRVVSDCCCHKDNDASAPTQARRQMRCCETLAASVTLTPASTGSSAQPRVDEAPAILLAVASIDEQTRVAATTARVFARGPPAPADTPLYLQHRSLLN